MLPLLDGGEAVTRASNLDSCNDFMTFPGPKGCPQQSLMPLQKHFVACKVKVFI